MTNTDTEFRIGNVVNWTESQYITLTVTNFIEQIQEIPGEEQQ